MMYKKFEDISKFRWWCHKVLPLVYDDSLSYYELLCKVMKKLNELIDRMNEFDVSELYALVKSLMEMTAGGVYDYETDGNYDNEHEYWVGDYVIYQNKLYKCILKPDVGEFNPECWYEINITHELISVKNNIAPFYDEDIIYNKGAIVRYTMGGEYTENIYQANKQTFGAFNPDDWDNVTVSKILTDYSNYRKKHYWSTFKSFNNTIKPYDEYIGDPETSENAREFASFDITNSGDNAWDNFMYDCDLFPLNSIMSNCHIQDTNLLHKPPFDPTNDTIFSVVTIGSTSSVNPLAISANSMFDDKSGNAIQFAITTDSFSTISIMVRVKPYLNEWTEWTEVGGSNTPIDNLDDVIGSTANTYDSTHTYYAGDFCTYNDGNGVKMYKALDTTTGSFDSTKWSVTNIINELGSTIIREPATTFSQIMGAIGSEVTP